MILFALDTSTRLGSMALWREGQVSAVALDDPRSHAERQPGEAMAWLSDAGLTLSHVTAFVVVSGPGSFTGLRVGVAAAQGWAAALGRPVHAVPTLQAQVRACPTDARAGTRVVPCLDGHRDEVFYGAWDDTVCVVPASVGTASEAVAAIGRPDGERPVVVVGAGGVRYAQTFAAAGWRRVDAAMTLAEAAVRLAAEGAVPPGLPAAVHLEYVRRTDAELARERRAAAGTA